MKANRVLQFFLAFLVFSAFILSTSCAGVRAGVSQESKTETAAASVTLTANPQSIAVGDHTTLSWTADNATEVTITELGKQPLKGSMDVKPPQTTTYVATAVSAGGNATAQVTVTVNAPSQPPPNAPTVTITANPQTIVSGGTSHLSWTSTNATTATIDGIGAVNPNDPVGLDVHPTVTTKYTISASGNGQPATASTTVTVQAPPPPVGTNGVFTSKYDNGRTGANTNETVLTPANVNDQTFGKLGAWKLDAAVFAQPLYVPGVTIGGQTYNVLYVATENDSVYALNADAPGTAPLWKRSFLGNGATIGGAYNGGRTSIGANVGITGTPVIDPATGRLYVCPRTTENNDQVYRVHAIDIGTGEEIKASPVINPVAVGTGGGTDGNGHIPFDALTQNQRPGLLLNNGVVYVGFASFSDHEPYHGWLVAFDANSLNMLDAYNTTPDGDGAGLWMAGTGPSADSSGNVYFATANSMPNETGIFSVPNDLSNSVVKLSMIGGKFALVDYFAPFNTLCLTRDDLDLGSSGVLLLPNGVGGRNMAVVGSKEGRIYLLDQDNLGKFHAGDDSQIAQSILINPTGCGKDGFDASSPMRMYGAPTYWNGNVYFGSAFGPLRQYSITSGKLEQVALGTYTYPASGQSGRGPIPIVSANGANNGIVWTAIRDLGGAGLLHAYDATNVNKLLYSTNYGNGSVFTAPTVINGKVYVTGGAVVYAYGLH